MQRALAVLAASSLLLGAAPALDQNTKTAVVFIANYDDEKNFLGWGSGFFVDEGIVVTNKHVIEGADWYRIIGTSPEGKVDFDCEKNVTKGDMKVNLEDDVAYIRVFLPCEHGVVRFADDPPDGEPVLALGYPYRGSVSASLFLLTTTGSVTGQSELGWLRTDAPLDQGSSGGPIVGEDGVAGVAVAGGYDEDGKYVTGFFIQSTVIVNGLLYANDSRFAYTPQKDLPEPRASSSSSSSRSSSVHSSSSSSRTPASSSRSSRPVSSARPSSSSVRAHPANSFEGRTCARVERWFDNSPTMKARVNERLLRRFGFACP